MKIIISTIALFCVMIINAQDNNDILLGVYIPEQAENIPSSAKNLLHTRMLQLITANGISGNLFSPRFILVPKVAVLDKEILGTAPPRVVLNLELTLIVGDGEKDKGNFFQTEYVNLKGVGQNEQKAYMQAIKSLSPRNPKIIDFLEHTKKEIIAYYEDHCDEVKKKAYALEAQDKTDEAVTVLANIPISSSCYSENEKDIRRFYQKVLNQQCDKKLNEARAIWYANQSIEGANEAGLLLAEIEPRAYCKDELRKLYREIALRVKELSNKDWDLKLKIVDGQMDSINHSRELILEYIKNQPQKIIHYDVRGW